MNHRERNQGRQRTKLIKLISIKSIGCFYQRWLKQLKSRINEFRAREKHTSNLYWFTLIPRVTFSPQKPLRIYYAIKIHITNNHTKEVTLNTSSTHTSFGKHTIEFRTTSDSTHTKEVILNTSITHTYLGKHTTEFRTTSDSAHTKEVILNTSRTHTSFGKHTTKFRTTFDVTYTTNIQKYN